MRRANDGFTLIEVLVVVSILAVLIGLVSVLIFKGESEKLKFVTNQRITQLKTSIDRYEIDLNRYPPMTLKELGKVKRYKGLTLDQNETNLCCEVLFVALHHPDLTSPLGDDLSGSDPIRNTDDDIWNQTPDGLGEVDAYEVVDAWGTPIVYIHKNHYGTPVRIVNWQGVEVEVNAVKKPDSNEYYNKDSFQLISLGEDGVQAEDYSDPGLVDDLANFKLRPAKE